MEGRRHEGPVALREHALAGLGPGAEGVRDAQLHERLHEQADLAEPFVVQSSA